MKIGILTLHDSINYGAVLQSYAMAEAYRALGHTSLLIDRRRNPRGWPLKWELAALPWHRRISWFLNATGIWCEFRRRRRTLKFLRERIGMTPYHFTAWSDAPADLGFDLVSVGSDQVWNSTINDPLDYMPGRIPDQVRTISYAASVGTAEFPAAICERCKAALSRFAAISVREQSSITLLERMNLRAEHVVDPVVLTGRQVWDALIAGQPTASGRIVVYLLGVYLPPCIDELMAKLQSSKAEVDFFVGGFTLEPLTRRGHPRLFKNLKLWRRYCGNPRFHLHLEDDPIAFVRAIASAEAVITSSYHALLFAIVYGRNVRYVLPDSSTPQHAMMVRIRDYSESIVSGPLLQPSLSAAWDSIAAGEATQIDAVALERRRQSSLKWLKGVL